MSLAELDQYLGIEHNINFWSDLGMDDAARLLDGLSEAEWSDLARLVPRPEPWRVRLVEALGCCDRDRCHALLEAALEDPSLEVQVAAVDALEGRDDVYAPGEAVRARLRALAPRFGPGDRETLEALMRRGLKPAAP